MWAKISSIILRNRILILSIVAVFTAVMFYFSRRVEMSYQMAQILPPSDKTYQDYDKFRKVFGEEANVIIIAIKDPSFFKMENLNAWIELESNIKQVNDIEWTLSPATCVALIKNDSLQKFQYQNLISEAPQNNVESDSIGKYFQSLPFYKHILWNPDSSVYLMLAGLDKSIIHTKDRSIAVENVRKIIHDFEQQQSKDLHISGLPFIRTDNVNIAKRETVLFTTLAAIMSSIILLIFFKSIRVLLVTLSQVGIGVIYSWGTMGILGYDITNITGILPPVLIVIGIPNAVYMINRFQQEYLKYNDRNKALSKMIEKTGKAMFLTNITTAVGFGTLAITTSKYLFEFGIVASINVILLFFLSLVWNTIMVSYLPNPKHRHTRHLTNKRSNFFINVVEKIITRFRTVILASAVVMVIVSVWGMTKIKTSGKVADDIPQHSDTYGDLKFFEDNFSGIMPFEVMIDTKKERKINTSPKLWKKINALQDTIFALKEFSRPVSFIELIKYANQTYYKGAVDHYELPNQFDLLDIQKYIKSNQNKKNDSLMQSYVDSTGRYLRIRAQMKDIGSFEMARIIQHIEKQSKEIFKDDDVDITFTGASVVILKGTQYLLRNLFSSITVAIIIIGLIMASMFRRFKMVIISLIPNILPLLLTAGAMGFMDIPLKASTIIIFGIAFGIVVDATIHFLSKYLHELKQSKGNIKEAVYRSIRENALSMTYTSLILFFGFSVFMASDFGATKALGILLSFTLAVGFFCDLLLLPTLLLSFQKKEIDKNYDKYILPDEDENGDE